MSNIVIVGGGKGRTYYLEGLRGDRAVHYSWGL